MATLAVAMPLAPGKGEEFKRFTEQVRTNRLDEHAESRRALGVTREQCWVESTPAGDLFILVLEADDPERANQQFAASTTPYDLWFKEQAGAIIGADFNQPIPPIAEQVFDWRQQP